MSDAREQSHLQAFWLVALFADAQNSKPFWVIETNLEKKNETIVRIYDQLNKLTQEETLSGPPLNIERRKDFKVKAILKQEAVASEHKNKHTN